MPRSTRSLVRVVKATLTWCHGAVRHGPAQPGHTHPATRKGLWLGAGYRYDDSSIVGFSHTHFSGTGHSDLGDILLMPFTGSPALERGDPEKPGSGYALASAMTMRRPSRATTPSPWTTTRCAPS